MVKSKKCYLRRMSRSDLVKHKEEGNEMGGYFICNGIERIIRCLIMQVRPAAALRAHASRSHLRGRPAADLALWA
jgi:DNA-directed RNA polymerase I subunit RPA2